LRRSWKTWRPMPDVPLSSTPRNGNLSQHSWNARGRLYVIRIAVISQNTARQPPEEAVIALWSLSHIP
jgi:hypothetical protein